MTFGPTNGRAFYCPGIDEVVSWDDTGPVETNRTTTMIVTAYRSESNHDDGKRYVGKSARGGYRWCIQNAVRPQFDTAQGTCDGDDLPDEIRAKCDAYGGVHYACEWPL